MRDIHPAWQHEDDEPVPVTVHEHATPKERTPKATQQISRRPAALVGMALVIGIGFTFFKGVEGLTGQLASNDATVHITENGFDPSYIEVEHGQTITFVNDSNVPHIVESKTLCSDTGYCLLTSTLFNGDNDNFTITPDMQAGTYDYASVIASDMTGQIAIVTDAVDDFVEVSDIVANDFFSDPVHTTTPPPTPTGFDPADFAPAPQQAEARLPTNPYTVNSDRMHPFDSSGDPIPEAFGDAPSTTADIQRQRAATAIASGRGPISQPQTGFPVWLALGGSILGLTISTRSAFAQKTL